MRPLGLVIALLIAAGAVMLYIRAIYLRPRQSRREIDRLLRENDELDRKIEEMRRNERTFS